MRRVVVTGVGLLTPIGNSTQTVLDALKTKRSGVRRVPEWDNVAELSTKVAGVVEERDFSHIPRKYRRSMDRVALIAAYTMQAAIDSSGLSAEAISHPRTGIAFGSTMGGNETLFQYIREVSTQNSFRGQTSMGFLKIMSHTVAANLAQMFQITGRNLPTCSACTSSSQAVGAAYESIKYGMSDIMFCGGSEGLHHLAAGVFDIMSAASSRYNDHPSQTPRPFDANRDGLIVGEGGATLVLEEYEAAKKRGATILGEVIGYATNCDGEHITTPSKEGMRRVMELALEDAGLKASDIGYINAHATSTEKGDIAESQAMHELFGATVPVSSTKGYMGHLLGGCGAVESAIALMALKEGFLPASLNLETVDPQCAPLNYLREGVNSAITYAMNNNFAFGGINTSLILKKI